MEDRLWVVGWWAGDWGGADAEDLACLTGPWGNGAKAGPPP